MENNAKKTSQFLDMFRLLLYNHAHECFAELCGATTLGLQSFPDFPALRFWGA